MNTREYKSLSEKDRKKINKRYQQYLVRQRKEKATFRPFSFDEYLENDILKCEICGNWEDVYFLVDHNAINGGLGLVCDNCKKKM